MLDCNRTGPVENLRLGKPAAAPARFYPVRRTAAKGKGGTMNRFARIVAWLSLLPAAVFAVSSLAHETAPRLAPAQATPYPGAGAQIDPVMRALLLGIAASILREAAAAPDPVEALGDAVERRLGAALANPNTMRLAESALQQALQDAPPELREPLTAFAIGVLRNMRREMAARPRPSY
jgi:hypothetical protein